MLCLAAGLALVTTRGRALLPLLPFMSEVVVVAVLLLLLLLEQAAGSLAAAFALKAFLPASPCRDICARGGKKRGRSKNKQACVCVCLCVCVCVCVC